MDANERCEAARRLACMLLMVDEAGNDLTLRYLKILIETGLPRTTAPRKILVAGAGIAGLVAGHLLKTAGHHVTILEANANRAGGRIKTWRGGEHFADRRQYAEAGAMRIPDFHPLTLSLVDKLRIRRRRFYNVDVRARQKDGGERVVYRDPHDGEKKWECPYPPVDSPGRPPEAARRTYIRTNGVQVRREDYAADPRLINLGFLMDRKQGVTTGRMLDDALEIVRDYYSEVGNGGVRRNFQDRGRWIDGWTQLIADFDQYSMLRFLREQARLPEGAIHAIGTIENLTSRLPLSFMHSFVGRSIINPGVVYWELENGMQSLTDSLALSLKDNIVYNARMIELRQDEGGVAVNTIPEPAGEEIDRKAPKTEWRADYAVVTIPFSALRFVDAQPLFSYKKRRAIIELHYDAATKVVLEFRRRWWEFSEADWKAALDPRDFEVQRAWMREHTGDTGDRFIGGGSVTDNPNRFVYYPSHPIDGSDGGVVLASYTWADDARRWDSIPDQNRYLYALKGLQQLHGPMIEKFWTRRGKTQAWSRDYYAFGEAAVFLPGQLTDLHPAVPVPEGRVHFAGEHTSLKHAWIEGAVESAIRAAIEVHER